MIVLTRHRLQLPSFIPTSSEMELAFYVGRDEASKRARKVRRLRSKALESLDCPARSTRSAQRACMESSGRRIMKSTLELIESARKVEVFKHLSMFISTFFPNMTSLQAVSCRVQATR